MPHHTKPFYLKIDLLRLRDWVKALLKKIRGAK